MFLFHRVCNRSLSNIFLSLLSFRLIFTIDKKEVRFIDRAKSSIKRNLVILKTEARVRGRAWYINEASALDTIGLFDRNNMNRTLERAIGAVGTTRAIRFYVGTRFNRV